MAYAGAEGLASVYSVKLCENELIREQVELPGVLGGGAVVRLVDGTERLLVGSYLVGSHQGYVERATEDYAIARVEWVGELRYEVNDRQIKIFEANETASFYFKFMNKVFTHNGQHIPVNDSVGAIPAWAKAPGFVGHAFNEKNLHLAPEFHGSQESLRHQINNALLVFPGVCRTVRGALDRGRMDRLEYTWEHIEPHLSAMQTALGYSFAKGLARPEDFGGMVRMVEGMSCRDPHLIYSVSDEQVESEVAVFKDPNYREFKPPGSR